jgi:type I restriction and modification enzyme subunit R-like protein
MEDEFIIREKKILSLLEQEIEEGEEMAGAVRHIAEQMLLKGKGYDPADIAKQVFFDVTLGAETVRSRVDYLVSVEGRAAMVIKCAAGSLSSRERHVVAAARVLGPLPIPVAVVMDPMSAVVLDSATGKVTGEGFDAIPTKPELIALLSAKVTKPIPADKLEREKRVLLAFDAIQCCIPKGADGGVTLNGPESCG